MKKRKVIIKTICLIAAILTLPLSFISAEDTNDFSSYITFVDSDSDMEINSQLIDNNTALEIPQLSDVVYNGKTLKPIGWRFENDTQVYTADELKTYNFTEDAYTIYSVYQETPNSINLRINILYIDSDTKKVIKTQTFEDLPTKQAVYIGERILTSIDGYAAPIVADADLNNLVYTLKDADETGLIELKFECLPVKKTPVQPVKPVTPTPPATPTPSVTQPTVNEAPRIITSSKQAATTSTPIKRATKQANTLTTAKVKKANKPIVIAEVKENSRVQIIWLVIPAFIFMLISLWIYRHHKSKRINETKNR